MVLVIIVLLYLSKAYEVAQKKKKVKLMSFLVIIVNISGVCFGFDMSEYILKIILVDVKL